MNKSNFALLLLTMAFSLFIIQSCNSPKQQAEDNKMTKLVDHELDLAVKQYKEFMTNIPNNKSPRTYDSTKGKVTTMGRTAWTAGFYPGTLWYLYEYSGDSRIKTEAEKQLKFIEPDQHFTGSHDIGFMMYCSFGTAYRITQNTHYKKALLTSAASLSTRFNDTVGAIRSWDWGEWKFPVIIDNMLNLELLCWASKNGGSKKYIQEAKSHANVTMKNHFRPDYSSFHVVNYNPSTGKVISKGTWQGLADTSAWARGQSWGLYGYTMMYRETKDSAYLNQAENIAHYILTNSHLPEDMIPYWDYDSPKIPNAYRDVSAAATMASAFTELSQFATTDKKAQKYKDAAKTILISLSNPPYRCKLGEDGGFLLKHSVGSKPGGVEIDVPLIYADYYYVEALIRYKNLFLNKKS